MIVDVCVHAHVDLDDISQKKFRLNAFGRTFLEMQA